MPIKINLDHITESISLDECYEKLIESKFDPTDEESFFEVAPILKKLSNNKTFLSEFMLEELKSSCSGQDKINNYTSQVIMLKPPDESLNFFMRANIWPAKDNPILKVSGEKSFFYHVPHDHNFNFLTSGYWGPGYGSDYYEYDYSKVVGYPGEKVKLHFIERITLKEGQLMLYRAYKDVHNQLPAESLSVSLNIMQSTWFTHLRSQYIFDEKCKYINKSTVTNDSSVEPLFTLTAEMGGENGVEFLFHTIDKSPVEENRFRALKAIVNSRQSIEEKKSVLIKHGLKSSSKLISNLSKLILAEIE